MQPNGIALAMDVRIISIGCLSAHPLWGERAAVRSGHATTTLIRTRNRVILVDPGLPAAALVARLGERANIKPQEVTDVFLTSFHPEARRGLPIFENAEWWIHEPEREAIGVLLATRLRDLAERGGEDDEDHAGSSTAVRAALTHEVATLERCRPAPDSLIEHVDLFPLPGVSPGTCGLLISARSTILICGDAVPTVEHLERGMVPTDAQDVTRAKESLLEAIEIADLIVPGRDNILANPTRRGM
jgi:glyoxylase-like metal-dependent hydrolase (beta-lactamase superfamily II)